MTQTEPRPFPGAPAYFRRLYVPVEEPPDDVISLVEEPLVIYGFARTSEYVEDRMIERKAWRDSRSFMAVCFSPLCPEGEMGMVRRAEVVEITGEEFAAAREAGGPQEVAR